MEILLLGAAIVVCLVCLVGIGIFLYRQNQDGQTDQILIPRAQVAALERVQDSVQGKKPDAAAAAIRAALPGYSVVTFYGTDPLIYNKFDAWNAGTTGLARTVAIIVGDDRKVASLTFGPTGGKGWWDGVANYGAAAPK